MMKCALKVFFANAHECTSPQSISIAGRAYQRTSQSQQYTCFLSNAFSATQKPTVFDGGNVLMAMP
jgi:hypothetical protein